MVGSFKFTGIPQVIFGSGKRLELAGKIKQYGRTAILLTGARSFINSGLWRQLQWELVKSELFINHHVIPGEPSPAMIDNIASCYKISEIDVVVAIGGGSVLDAGKALAAMIGKDESVKNFLEGVGTKKPDGSTLPFIALPTTSGTGSECTKNAVISEVGEKGYKKSLRHDNFVPDVAIVDPELTLSCPRQVTAASGMDAFTQLLESYLSTNASPMTDALAMSGMGKIRDNFEEAMRDGQNLQAREGLAYASMISGITLANAGLGTVHGLASSLGGRYNIPHGVICGTLMAPCNRLTIKKIQKTGEGEYALNKYAATGELFYKKPKKPAGFYIDFLIDLIEDWTEKFAIPRFSEYISAKDHFPQVARESGNKNNPVNFNEEELLEILESRF